MDITTIETDTEETQIVVVDRGTPGIEDSEVTIVEDPETTALPEQLIRPLAVLDTQQGEVVVTTEGVPGTEAMAGVFAGQKTLYGVETIVKVVLNWENLNASNKWNANGIDGPNVVD